MTPSIGPERKWHPIATAPRDGTKFDAWCDSFGGFRIPDVSWEPRYVSFFSEDAGALGEDLTHWMPLPSPPKAQQ